MLPDEPAHSRKRAGMTTTDIENYSRVHAQSGDLHGLGSSLPGYRGVLPPTAEEPPDEVPLEYDGGAATAAGPPSPTPPTQHVPLVPDETANRISRKTKASIKLATLNMKERAAASLGPSQISKWTEISSIMRTQRISVLAVQETHLTEEHVESIHTLHGKRIQVINSSPLSNSAGVAFVLNRELTNVQDLSYTVLVPGRAIVVTTKWHQSNEITLLNVYAPNRYPDHLNFWDEVRSKLRATGTCPDFLMGDFNIVEDPLDRAPARNDDEPATTALRDLRMENTLVDAWRHSFPDTRMFTYRSNTGMQSRLDRIYAKEPHVRHLFQWDAGPSGVPTDHDIVSVRFAPSEAPYVGEGHWTWLPFLIADPLFLAQVTKLGLKLEEALTNIGEHHTNANNPQREWQTFKKEITQLAKKTARAATARIDNKVRSLKRDIAKLANNETLDTDKNTRLDEALLHSELDHLEKKRRSTVRARAQAQWVCKGETVSKYWTKTNSEKKPKDTIQRLTLPGSKPPKYTTRSEEMAKIGWDYHDAIQKNPQAAQ